jgi:glycosyltransferase involved in cell wall biosynthesis
MKLLVVTGIFPPDHGGPASYVAQLCGTFKTDAEVKINAVITLSDRPSSVAQYDGFCLVRIRRSLNFPLRFLFTILSIIYYGLKSDVIYLNGLVFEGIIASKIILKKPVAVKVVGDLIWEKAKNKKLTSLDIDSFQVEKLRLPLNFQKKLQSWYTSKADIVITPSLYLKNIVLGWGVSEKKIKVIYNAVPLKNLFLSNQKNNKNYDVITVSRLVPWKGIERLIEVCIENNWTLRIIGDGPMMSQLRKLSLGREDLISFSGYVRKDDVQTEIRNSKVFVLNSSYEGLPHIVIEAKAAGVPVVATSVGGTPETIDHMINGILIPEGDSRCLITAIKKLLNSSEIANFLVENAYKQIQHKFLYETMYLETKRILLTINKKKK